MTNSEACFAELYDWLSVQFYAALAMNNPRAAMEYAVMIAALEQAGHANVEVKKEVMQ